MKTYPKKHPLIVCYTNDYSCNNSNGPLSYPPHSDLPFSLLYVNVSQYVTTSGVVIPPFFIW